MCVGRATAVVERRFKAIADSHSSAPPHTPSPTQPPAIIIHIQYELQRQSPPRTHLRFLAPRLRMLLHDAFSHIEYSSYRPRQQILQSNPRLPRNPPELPIDRPHTRSDSSISISFGDIISRGASRHSNPRSPPPKHAYYLPHSSPSTPSTTISNSPATAFQKALEHDQEAAVTQLHYAHPRPHQALTPASTTLKRNNNVTPLSPTGRLWDHPSLRGRSRHSTPHSKKRIAPVSYNVLGFFPIQERVNFNTRSYISIACVLVPCVCVAAPLGILNWFPSSLARLPTQLN